MNQTLLALAAACAALSLPASLHAASGSAEKQQPKSQARNVADIVRRVEQGLVPAVLVGGQPPPALSLADEMRARNVPGVSIAVIHNYKIDWTRSYGITKVEDSQAGTVTPDTRFLIASLSKSMTAVGALRMVQDGKLALDAPVNSALKSWQLPENDYTRATPVTLRRLLNHTAGINNHDGPEGCYPRGKEPTLLQTLKGAPPSVIEPVVVQWPVGEAARYSNNGFAIVEQLLIDNAGPSAKTAGDPFADILLREVFKPAGMRDSTLQTPLAPGKGPKNFAWPHDNSGKPTPEGPLLCPAASGGVWASAPDVARFVIALQKATEGRGGLLSKQSAATMLHKGLDNWGLGIGIGGQEGNPYFSYAGASVGYQPLMIGYPATGDGVVVLTNGNGGGVLALEIARAVSREYGWPDIKPVTRTPVELEASALERFTGSYLSEDLGPFSVRVQEAQGPADKTSPQLVAQTLFDTLRLLPLSDNSLFSPDRDLVFTFEFDSANAAVGGSIAFGTRFTGAFKPTVPDAPGN